MTTVAILFLTPVSATTSVVFSLFCDIKYTSLSFLRWTALALGSDYLTIVKENLLGNKSTRH